MVILAEAFLLFCLPGPRGQSQTEQISKDIHRKQAQPGSGNKGFARAPSGGGKGDTREDGGGRDHGGGGGGGEIKQSEL